MPHTREDAGETEEFRRERNGKRAKLAGLGAMAGIVLAVPYLLGWIGDVYKISQAPTRLDAVESAQRQNVKDMQDMKESLARIEGALHIIKSPKLKDQEP